MLQIHLDPLRSFSEVDVTPTFFFFFSAKDTDS